MNNETEQIFLLNSENLSQKVIEVPAPAPVNLENVEDFSNVCRMCATVTEFVMPIFEGEGAQHNLADKIHKHLPIQVTQQDLLPLSVCYQCLHTLLAWHELAACCAQADVALRTRLHVLQAEQESKSRKEECQSLENKEQKEFEEIAEFIVPAPPEYPASTPSLRVCDYCSTEHPDEQYRDHLISTHSDFLFQCDECDTYVHRKDFILHMSLHAVQYASTDKEVKEAKKVKKVKKRKAKDENENMESDQKTASPVEETTSEQIDNITTQTEVTVVINEQNEFSDQSDTEYGFGPLPESVFEAIEDSQDSQPADNEVHTPEITEYNENLTNEQDSTNELFQPPERNKQKKHKRSRTCPICSKVYTASSSYFYHMKYFHNSVKEHECQICGRKFGTKGSLTQHSTIHTGECQFECKDCGKKFRSKASLYIHEQTHNGIKTWACTQCHISFRWRTHLMRHIKRHSAEKAHICSTCGRGFNIKCDLLRHARTHTAGNFTCDKCGVKFAQLRYLKVHMDKKHSAAVENVPSA